MIYTLTMNPAVDMNISSQGIRPKVVNRTRDSFYSHNGKGINLTRVLRHFGVESAAIGFFGAGAAKKKSVSTCSTSSSVTASTVATSLNNLINALKGYGLIS